MVDIQLRRDSANGLLIDWLENGGAPVVPPTRRGFGSTIIERAIPHELSGTASLDYALDGLRARFMIPEAYISEVGQNETQVTENIEPVAQDVARLSGKVLLVEDNLLIALETEDALRTLGAEDVQIASTTNAALSYLLDHRPDFALLDYNLGREQSAPVADRLVVLDIPFSFATGYGDTAVIDARFRGRPVLSKPYAARALLNAFNAALRHQGSNTKEPG